MGMDPAICFAFGKKTVEKLAEEMGPLELTTQTERQSITAIYENALQTLSEDDQKLPQVFIYTWSFYLYMKEYTHRNAPYICDYSGRSDSRSLQYMKTRCKLSRKTTRSCRRYIYIHTPSLYTFLRIYLYIFIYIYRYRYRYMYGHL